MRHCGQQFEGTPSWANGIGQSVWRFRCCGSASCKYSQWPTLNAGRGRENFYLAAAIAGGAIAPLRGVLRISCLRARQFGRIVAGLGHPIAAATLTDFTMSCLVFWLFVFVESKRHGIRWPWFYVVTNVLIGSRSRCPHFCIHAKSSTPEMTFRCCAKSARGSNTVLSSLLDAPIHLANVAPYSSTDVVGSRRP